MRVHPIIAVLVAIGLNTSVAIAGGFAISPDQAANLLHCLHPTARFRGFDEIERPWSRGSPYGATNSSLLRITFAGGITNRPYAMDVALLERSGLYRAVIEADNAQVPPNER